LDEELYIIESLQDGNQSIPNFFPNFILTSSIERYERNVSFDSKDTTVNRRQDI